MIFSIRLGDHLSEKRLPRIARDLAARFPMVPRVVRMTRTPDVAVLANAYRGGSFRIDGLLLDGRCPAAELRPVLAVPDQLPTLVGDWLRCRHPRLAPHLGTAIRGLFASAGDRSQLSHALASLGIARTTIRSSFAKRRLPAPSQWFCAARALQAAVRLQADPERSLGSIAFELGYAEPSGLSNLVQRSFGVRPTAIRRTLGIGWMMDRWAGARHLAGHVVTSDGLRLHPSI